MLGGGQFNLCKINNNGALYANTGRFKLPWYSSYAASEGMMLQNERDPIKSKKVSTRGEYDNIDRKLNIYAKDQTYFILVNYRSRFSSKL